MMRAGIACCDARDIAAAVWCTTVMGGPVIHEAVAGRALTMMRGSLLAAPTHDS
jgi:hypothetical protein